ncbi:hypothetical protein DC3_39840 [Deinococcus cellulosilyticus NBRC 106333 = KACC 11606]|uniref:Uncharacterized protein n=1 Tax=Deinococcus cellulosilyticus (strain DSM 18568 / NBRC 106333 / KACC 11606 / 5516J-15) TaxID=1223518 RepID=A0A511N660_DEIC1|nr:hypothetical protein DC3_39840 [Deinococcus cellulosilyticus NBRC 106333 = KACC 11606]
MHHPDEKVREGMGLPEQQSQQEHTRFEKAWNLPFVHPHPEQKIQAQDRKQGQAPSPEVLQCPPNKKEDASCVLSK